MVVKKQKSCLLLNTWGISLFLFVFSCQPQKFDVLPIPTDSSTLYFQVPSNINDGSGISIDSFGNRWYSQMLFALKEPVLYNYRGGKEIYRFTWLRTFNHPVVIRLEKQNDNIKLFSKIADGAGGYEPGNIIWDSTRNLSKQQVDSLNAKLEQSGFWNLKPESRDSAGKDGSEWIFEVYKNGNYHFATKWTPAIEHPFRTPAEYLISLSNIKKETNPEDYY